MRLHSNVIFQSVCLQHSPDCVGDLADTEAAGGLRRVSLIVPPHIPLHLWHKLERLSYFTSVLRLLGLNGVKRVNVSGGQCATPKETFPNTACLRSVSSCPQVRFAVKTPRRPAGPVFVSVQPVQSSSVEALVSLRDHKHTVKLTLSQRTLIRSCIRNTHKKKLNTHTHAE